MGYCLQLGDKLNENRCRRALRGFGAGYTDEHRWIVSWVLSLSLIPGSRSPIPDFLETKSLDFLDF